MGGSRNSHPYPTYCRIIINISISAFVHSPKQCTLLVHCGIKWRTAFVKNRLIRTLLQRSNYEPLINLMPPAGLCAFIIRFRSKVYSNYTYKVFIAK